MKNPLVQFRADLVKLAQMSIDLGAFAASDLQVGTEKAIRRILKKYAIKKRNQPKYRATTK